MTLTEKQQEHRRWLEGLSVPPEQKQGALLLWDSLTFLLPQLEKPTGALHRYDYTDDTYWVVNWWANGKEGTVDYIWLSADVQPDGLVQWTGWCKGEVIPFPSTHEEDRCVAYARWLPTVGINCLRTYFTEPEATSG